MFFCEFFREILCPENLEIFFEEFRWRILVRSANFFTNFLSAEFRAILAIWNRIFPFRENLTINIAQILKFVSRKISSKIVRKLWNFVRENVPKGFAFGSMTIAILFENTIVYFPKLNFKVDFLRDFFFWVRNYESV